MSRTCWLITGLATAVVAAVALVAVTTSSEPGHGANPATAAGATTSAGGSGSGEFTSIYTQWPNGPDPSGNPDYFPIGVYYQSFDSPAPRLGNEDSVVAYDAAGINLQVGGYDCDGGYCNGSSGVHGGRDPNLLGGVRDNTPSHPVACACAVMGENGAENELPPLTEINLARQNPATIGAVVKANFVTGYDEADMNEVNHAVGSEYSAPKVSAAYAAMKAADPSRPVVAGYGLCFAIPNWNGCGAYQFTGVAGETGTQALRQYCSNADIVSSDNYADANQSDGPGHDYAYGQIVDNERSICGSDKVLGFDVETGDCCGGSIAADSISTADIEAATWDGIMHGAHFVNYFVDDIPNGEFIENGLLQTDHVAAYAQVKADDAEIAALAPWLNAPSLSGVSVTSTGGIPMTTMLKTYNGHTYLFAMADGNRSHQRSGSTTATLTYPGASDANVIVYDEGRTIAGTGNTITDTFSPYQMHIYELS